MSERPRCCETCPLTADGGADPEAALAAIDRCEACPLAAREQTAAAALRLLKAAATALRTARAELRRCELERRELDDGLRADGERITKLERLQLASAGELETALRERDELLRRVSGELRRVSTPILEVGDGVLALPIVGQFDERRAAEARDDLLQAVSRRGASQVVIDLTGVDELDVATARRLVDLCRALRLLGASVALSAIGPAVAQALTASDIDLAGIRTLPTLKAALRRT